eukprot:GEMP01035142.1.p1 GENE.GEMP01035142.1~~GEMP01035142.1.p1  ORF type:complete len:436 (-),score=104.91 GEMP01035142.1:416-1723(-)
MGFLNKTYSQERMLLYMHLRTQSHSVQEGNRQNVRPSVAHFETLRDAPSQSSHETPASETHSEFHPEATSKPFPSMNEVLLPPEAFPPHLIGNRVGLLQKFWGEDGPKRMDADEIVKQEARRKSPTPQQCDVPRHYASGEQRIGGARGAVPLYSVAFCTCNCSDPYCMLQILRPGQVQPQEQQYQYQQKQQELEMRQQQLQMRLPVRPKAVYHHSHVDRVIPGKHVCIANDVAYVYPGKHGMSVRNYDSCANYFSTNPLGRNITREQCSQQQHERQIPLKESPLSPLSQDSDEELLALGNINAPPGLDAQDPRFNLRNVVVQELSASEWTTIDDVILRDNVMAAWMACGRHPLWKLLKPFSDFVQEQDPETMYWKIKRADPVDIEAELPDDHSFDEKKPDMEATPATRASSGLRVEDTPGRRSIGSRASSSFQSP